MRHSNLQQTRFSIEKLKNAVNVGSSSVFQIYTTPGKPLGYVGKIAVPAELAAVNESEFSVDPECNAPACEPESWFRRVLGMLRR